MKVLLRSSLHNGTERGEDSFELIAELIRLGADVFLDPVDIHPPVPNLVATILARPYPSRFDLMLHYVDPSDAGVSKEFSSAADMNVLWTKHDSTMFNKRLIPNLGNYDAILTQDEITLNALTDLTNIPLGVLTAGFHSEPWSLVQRNWDDHFTFSMVLTGDGHEYPEIAIEAFHKLRDIEEFQDAALVIKTSPYDNLNMKLMEHVPDLFIIKENWSKAQFKTFYRDTNVMLSPDRGGSRNKAALEFMSTGGVVIATNWSLNKSWLSRAYSYPLKYDLVSVSHKDPRNKYANPDGYNLQELMLEAAQNKQAAKQKGQVAADVISSMLDWSKVVESMFQMLDEIEPEQGTALYEKYKRCTPIMKVETASWKM